MYSSIKKLARIEIVISSLNSHLEYCFMIVFYTWSIQTPNFLRIDYIIRPMSSYSKPTNYYFQALVLNS